MMPTGISSYRAPFMGTTHVVASNNYHASAAGYAILRRVATPWTPASRRA